MKVRQVTPAEKLVGILNGFLEITELDFEDGQVTTLAVSPIGESEDDKHATLDDMTMELVNTIVELLPSGKSLHVSASRFEIKDAEPET